MLLRILFFATSLLLYIKAPLVYDWKFCLICMIIYLAEVALCVGKEFQQGNYLTFNLVFFFSFFWTSFAYPVLVYDTPAGYLNIMIDHINWDVLSKTTSLCLLFASTYLLAYGNPHMPSINNTQLFRDSGGKALKWLKIAFVLLIFEAFIYLYRAGFSYAEFAFDVAFWDVYFILLAHCLIEKSKEKSENCTFKEFVKLNKFPMFSALFIVLAFMAFGDRGPAIKSFLVCGACYYYFYNKISIKKIALVGLVGVSLMFFIRQTRQTDSIFTTITDVGAIRNVFSLEDGLIYMFADLYGASMELNIGYDYAQHHELFHPERVLAMPLTAVPFLPTIVLSLFGTSMDDFYTGMELNRQMSTFDSHFGNHVVADLYMSVGLIGLLIFAFLLGKVSKKLASLRFHSEPYAVAYMMLFAVALYLPRDSVFSLVRPLALSFILLFFLLPKRIKK